MKYEFPPLKCLSVAQPWAWAIFHGKDFENRKWHSKSFNGPLLIQASTSSFFSSGVEWLRNEGYECPDFRDLPKGVIVGIVDHIGCWHLTRIKAAPVPATIFAEGPYCHVLQRQTEFAHPIQCKGQLGLFDVDLDTVRNELNQLPADIKNHFRSRYERCYQCQS